MIMKKGIIIGGLLLLVAVIAAVSHYGTNLFSKYSTTNTPTDVLLKQNSDFARAKALSHAGNYQAAEDAYNEALKTSEDNIQKAQIQYNIAAQKDHQLDYVGAVTLFKQIADDTNNVPIMRANAVKAIADINNNADPSVAKVIFNSEPYTSMVVAGDAGLTNRHLAEYASSIYPLGLTEMYIAYWYAEHITASSTDPMNTSYVGIIQKKIKSAEADIERTKNDSGAMGGIPDIIQYEARVKGDLAIAGAGSASDAEDTFQRAFTAMTTYGMAPWYDEYTRMNYAIFLMRMFGKNRASDIHSTLSPIYTNPVYKNAPIVTTLKNIAAGGPVDPNKKKYIGKLANYDSGWKTYLLSLGWTAADFK